MIYLILYTRITIEPRFCFQKAYSVPTLLYLLFQIIIASINILTPTASVDVTTLIRIYTSYLSRSYYANYKIVLIQKIFKNDQYKKIKILPTRIILTILDLPRITLTRSAIARQISTLIGYYSLESIRSNSLLFIPILVETTRKKKSVLTLPSFVQIYN